MEPSELEATASAFEQEIDPEEWVTVDRPPIPPTGKAKRVIDEAVANVAFVVRRPAS